MKTLKALALPALLSAFFVLTSATQAGKEKERIEKSTLVLQDFKAIREKGIPPQIMDQAEGVVIIPGLLNGGFVVGGKRGRGVALVKTDKDGWSDPVFVTFTGGSLGLQAGVQSIDLVLVFKHKGVLAKVENGDFTVGGDVSAAAGPVGRSSSANTDYKLEAEVYSYSRSRGLFAGISINGSNIGIDKDAIAKFYGSNVNSHELFASNKSNSAEVGQLKAALNALK
jgi:SH3 domain-containing YSC84-like protein 1